MAAQSDNTTAWRRPSARKWILISAIAAIVAAFLLAKGFGGPSAADVAPKPGLAAGQLPLVSVTTARLRPVTSTVTFIGTLHARYDMPIGAEGEGGRIVAVLVEAGDRVKRGQLLAKLDQSVPAPQVTRLAASLEEARAQAALSAAEFQRAKSIGTAGALSLEEIERRRATAVTDEARVKVADAQLAEAQARFNQTHIRSPADGLVLTRDAEIGQMAAPGEPLFRVAGESEIEMRGQVAERDIALLSVGQHARVYLTGLAKPFEGRVRLLGAVIDPQSRQGDIRIALSPDPAQRPGAFARGEVIVSNAQRPMLPQTAVLSDTRGTYVFVVTPENKVLRRPVRVASSTPDGIVIAEGLDGQERVVVTAGGFLRDGELIAIASEKT